MLQHVLNVIITYKVQFHQIITDLKFVMKYTNIRTKQTQETLQKFLTNIQIIILVEILM